MPNPKPEACLTLDELNVGDRVELDYTITDEDVQKFGEISGDFNPAHFNEAYAADTRFGQRIAHGMISVAKFSGLFGMHMPGLGAIWAEQNVRFKAPVYLDAPYTAIAEIIEKTDKFVKCRTWVEDQEGDVMLEGEGVLYPIPAKVKDKMGADLNKLLAES